MLIYSDNIWAKNTVNSLSFNLYTTATNTALYVVIPNFVIFDLQYVSQIVWMTKINSYRKLFKDANSLSVYVGVCVSCVYNPTAEADVPKPS